MRKITFLLFLLFSFKSFAQVAPLQDYTWYLEKLVINGNDILPPTAYQNSYTVTFGNTSNYPENYFEAPCYPVEFELTYNQNQSFTIDFAGSPLDCDGVPTNVVEYDERILEDFFNLGYSAFNPYTYVFSTFSNYIELTITNGNGDQAVYRNQQLAVSKKEKLEVNLYPNPVSSNFQLEWKEEIRSVRVFSVNGKEILKYKEAKSNYDISHFNSGIYFVEVEGRRSKSILKLIKR